ncbi:MAG: hypothetical protein WC393_00070 [Candidatus Nanoarchaeia archaeon]|jgi:Zn-finger nucleic acid-binding protein
MICPNCNLNLINTPHESYCPRCGLVYNDYLNYGDLMKGMSPFNSSWRANFPQTMKPYKNVGGRMIMKKEYECIKAR